MKIKELKGKLNKLKNSYDAVAWGKATNQHGKQRIPIPDKRKPFTFTRYSSTYTTISDVFTYTTKKDDRTKVEGLVISAKGIHDMVNTFYYSFETKQIFWSSVEYARDNCVLLEPAIDAQYKSFKDELMHGK